MLYISRQVILYMIVSFYSNHAISTKRESITAGTGTMDIVVARLYVFALTDGPELCMCIGCVYVSRRGTTIGTSQHGATI
jgi:hypothetical protein